MNVELWVLWILVGWVAQQGGLGPVATGIYMPVEGVYFRNPLGRWLPVVLTSVIGGLGGGLLYNALWPIDFSASSTGIAVAASAVGAFVGARVLDNIFELGGMVLGMGSPKK